MKILYLTPGCFDKGGISRYCRYQIQALKETQPAGETHFASLMGPEEDSFEDDFTVDYHGKSNSRFEQIKFALHFIKVALTKRPKFIHVAHVNFSGLAQIVSRFIGAKTILNVYGLEIWSKLSRDASFGLRNVDYIISDCHNTKDYLVNNKIRSESDIQVIWDCVDLNRFRPYSSVSNQLLSTYNLPNKEGNFIILTLGRIAYAAKHKGYHRLIEVFANLKDPKFKLVFAGKGNMVDELKQICADKGISDRVTFTGMVHDDDMGELYSYADVFSLVSETGEGMGEGIPLTPIEAMACGTPIVVGDMDGSREAIHDNRNGFVVPSHNLESHKQAILDIKANLEAFEVESSKVAQEFFSYREFKEKHKAYYQQLD